MLVPDLILFWTTPSVTFQPRNRLVLESYLHHHPKAHIRVYATHLTEADPLLADLTSSGGYHVEIIRLGDLSQVGPECPGREWLLNPAWKQGRYYYSHLTDFLRFCLLYSHGGIYSDFDAILLNPLPATPRTFIGRDEAGVNKGCPWCFAGGTGYLAPGLMAAEKSSLLAKTALTIGFQSGYDPEIFNLVGPQAVTKAYKQYPDSAEVFESHVFYPYKYWQVDALFAGGEAPGRSDESHLILTKLRRRSLSLHLYGHMSSRLPVETNSVVDIVNKTFSLASSNGGWDLRTPEYVGIKEGLQLIPDCRLLHPHLPKGGERLVLTIAVTWGTIGVVGSSHTETSGQLSFEETTAMMINFRLANLAFRRPEAQANSDYRGRPILTISLEVCDGSAHCHTRIVKSVALLDIAALVTVITKTMDRMEKVFHLVRSVHQFYPEIKILVADDGEGAQTQTSGEKRGFAYHVLPYDTGLSGGRNFLVERVPTEYFVTVDDDFTFDEDSRLEDLLWQAETGRCDLVAGKNPHDEKKYGFEFMGLINVTGEDMRLEAGSYSSWAGCDRVDIVPNLFIAKTSLIRNTLVWDSRLKIGEHEDFFLRAKQLGVRVCSCKAASFMHHPANWAQRKTTYDKMRNRIHLFWKISLEKHHLKRLYSFSFLMIDISSKNARSLTLNVLFLSFRVFSFCDFP